MLQFLFDEVVYGFWSKLAGEYLLCKYSIVHGIDIFYLVPVFIGDRLSVE